MPAKQPRSTRPKRSTTTRQRRASSAAPPDRATLTTPWGESIDASAPLPEYPRPQLVREQWRSLNGVWEHAVRPAEGALDASPAREPVPDEFDGPIVVPFAIESAASGVQRALLPGEVLHYRRRVEIPADWRGRRVVVTFEAVDHRCVVRVDGRVVGAHRGGYLPFTVELPDTDRDEVELTVAVRDPSDSGLQQRGKQALLPESIWYTATSGIWQSVWMEPLPPLAVSRVLVRPVTTLDAVEVEVVSEDGSSSVGHLGANRPDDEVRLELEQPDGSVVTASGRTDTRILVRIPGARPWSPQDPHLYPLRVRTAYETVRSYAAIRTVEIGPIPGASHRERHAILLNGRPVLPNTPLSQGYWPESGMTPPSDEALVHDLQTMRDMGFNGVRVHVKVEPRRFYHHADRLGMLVVQDCPNGGRPRIGLRRSALTQALDLRHEDTSDKALVAAGRDDPENQREFAIELAAMVRTLKSHPSIIMWVPFNEAWGQFDARAAESMVRRLDPSRLVDAASGWFDQGNGDVRSRHRYVQRLRRPPARDRRPFSLSEFGGLNLPVAGHVLSTDDAFGYRFLRNPQELARALTALYRDQLIPLARHGLRACTYTQISDVEIETNGLLTWDRRVTKVPTELVRTLNEELYAAFAALGS